MSNHTAVCETCNARTMWDYADDFWRLTEEGWQCDTCEEEWMRDGLAMAQEYAREMSTRPIPVLCSGCMEDHDPHQCPYRDFLN
jgi:hypothetical protein